MRKKFIIPILGLFVAVLAISFSRSTPHSDTGEMSGLFVESDNVAFAEASACVQRSGWFCIYNGKAIYNYQAVYL